MGQPAVSEQQKTVATTPKTVEKGHKPDSNEQRITKLISQSPESQQEAAGKIDVLSGIANNLKLDHMKVPAVKQHLLFIGFEQPTIMDKSCRDIWKLPSYFP